MSNYKLSLSVNAILKSWLLIPEIFINAKTQIMLIKKLKNNINLKFNIFKQTHY